MRTAVITFAGLIALAAASAHATPVAPTQGTDAELGAGPPIELVAHGCGYGQRRTQWQDQWGQWHWSLRSEDVGKPTTPPVLAITPDGI